MWRHLGPQPGVRGRAAIYEVGSLTTALSPNLAVLLVGWSGVEGFGAVLVVPAIAVAAGPLIGGWVTTELSRSPGRPGRRGGRSSTS